MSPWMANEWNSMPILSQYWTRLCSVTLSWNVLNLPFDSYLLYLLSHPETSWPSGNSRAIESLTIVKSVCASRNRSLHCSSSSCNSRSAGAEVAFAEHDGRYL